MPGWPFRERCLDSLTTNWAFPARSGIFEDREFPSRGARDSASGVVYLYSEHYQGQGEPASHAQAIRARGVWILGVIDPACLGSSQIDGRTLMEVYRKLGLHLGPAENAVEAGITEVWNLLVSGQLKVLASLTNWLREFRKYHRDDKGSGEIVKRDDHLMKVWNEFWMPTPTPGCEWRKEKWVAKKG